MSNLYRGILPAVAALLFSACMATAEEAVATHEVPLNHWKHAMMTEFAEDVAGRTDGAVEFSVFPAGQLYSDVDAVAALGTGAVQMAWPVTVHLETIEPSLGFLNLPFSLTFDQMTDEMFYNDLLGLANEYLVPKGVRLLGLLRSSEGIFVFREREVTSLEDMQGLKVRVVGGKLFQDTVAAFGSSPVSVPGPELVSSMSQGVIDGAVTSAAGWRDMGDSGPYAAAIPGFSLILFAIVVDDAWLQGLDEETRNEVTTAVDEMVKNQWKNSRKVDEDIFAKRAEDGAKMWRATEEEAAAWREKAEAATSSFSQSYPDAYEKYQAIVEEFGSRN